MRFVYIHMQFLVQGKVMCDMGGDFDTNFKRKQKKILRLF